MHSTTELIRARQLIQNARSAAVLTGAGVSAESGIPTFRGQDGFWQGMSAQALASPQGFARNPGKVWEWYNSRRNGLKALTPNAGHFALAELEKRIATFGVVTQNVDRLHRAAGTKNLLELHGNIWDVRCTVCHETFDRTNVELPAEPRCDLCGEWLRPAVVWFGDMLPHGVFEQAEQWVRRSELFLIVGTSAVVMPAAGLAHLAKERGATVIEINMEETPATKIADIALRGKSGEILPRLVN